MGAVETLHPDLQGTPLTPGVVHVWFASLEPPPAVAARLPGLLSADERERASRFVFAHYRNRWVAGRAFLRLLLARYLACNAAGLRFSYAEHGRPALAGPDCGLRFNLAHSEVLAVCSLAYEVEVGVDIEHMRPMRDALSIASSYFTPGESAELVAAGQEGRERAFFRLWTRKEAVLKSTGEGLVRPLSSFSVSLVPGAPARFEGDDTGAPFDMSLYELEPEPGYIGALALPGIGWQIHSERWSWQPFRLGW